MAASFKRLSGDKAWSAAKTVSSLFPFPDLGVRPAPKGT